MGLEVLMVLRRRDQSGREVMCKKEGYQGMIKV
jgi:hypothetical protein